MDLLLINLTFVIVLAMFRTSYSQDQNNFKITSVERLVDLKSQITVIKDRITIKNVGSSAADQFLYIIEADLYKHVSGLYAAIENVQLSVKDNYKGKEMWAIQFTKPLQPGSSVSIFVVCALTELLTPYPASITQQEKQFVKFIGNSNFYSPYMVDSATVIYDLSSSVIEEYTKTESSQVSGSRIQYKSQNISPYSVNEITIHFENNNPFIIVDHLTRSVEISHWGNIAFEDDISLIHTGAKLKGPFSRYDFQKDPNGSPSCVRSFVTTLPKTVSDIYYRDEIGNISTSSVYKRSGSGKNKNNQVIDVELRPRFPLFGGWRTRYTLGYNLPLGNVLETSTVNGKFLLKIPLVPEISESMVIREAVINVIFPEGSSDIKLNGQFPILELPPSLHYTYLDIIGRPVISFKIKNVTKFHTTPFTITYNYPKIYMLLEPALIIISLFIFFLTVIIYVRLDFSLSKDQAVEHKLKISGICEKILSLQDNRLNLYRQVEEKLNVFKHNKDTNSFNNYFKIFVNDHKTVKNQISELAALLKSESPEMFEKVAELQKLDKIVRDLINQQQVLYTDKLVPGKLSKTQFADSDISISKKKEDCLEKIMKILRTVD